MIVLPKLSLYVHSVETNKVQLTCERLDENLHAAAKAENEMEGRFFLNIIVAERAAIFELLAGEDEALLVGRNLKMEYMPLFLQS